MVCNSCYTNSMQSLAEIMAKIENARPVLSQMAGYADFEAQYLALSDELLAGATEETLLPRLIALLQKFPNIAHKAGLGEVVSSPPAEEKSLPPAPNSSTPESTGGVRMTTPAPEPAPRTTSSFKTEDFITIFKEVVTAIIAILLVATTVRMLWVSLQLVGDEMRINQARELIMVMTGLVGAVIGYYFGRIPADARAAQAQQQAQQATEERAEISAQAENLAESVERVIRRLPREAATLRGEGNEPLTGELDALQESIQQLRALSRRR